MPEVQHDSKLEAQSFLERYRLRSKTIDRLARIFSILIGGAIGASAAERLAQAQEATDLGPAINNIEPNPAYREAGRAQFVPGVSEDRLRMIFSASTEALGTDLYGAEFRLELSGDGSSLVFRQLGSVGRHPISSPLLWAADWVSTEYNRADGRRNIIQFPGIDESSGELEEGLDLNGEARWMPSDPGFGCPNGGIQYIHRSQNPNELVILVRMPVPGRPGRLDPDAWRVNVNAPNYCTAIADDIAAADVADQTPEEAGLLDPRESTSYPEVRIAVDETLEAVTRDVGVYSTYFYWINPDTGERIHLQRNPDGTWTAEDPQTLFGSPETGLTGACSMIKRTIGGRVFHLYVFETTDPALYDGAPILKVLALEETPPGSGTFTEVPLEMAEEAAEADDDNDTVANNDDMCAWLANPDRVDTNGDGIPDACEATCDTNRYYGDAPAGGTNPSGLAVCDALPDYPIVRRDTDGSKIESNMEVALAPDGAITLSPGQTVRYIHTDHPLAVDAPSRSIRFPDRNSVHVKINETRRLNGDPGTATLTYRPYEDYDPLAAPVTVNFDGPTAGVVDYPPSVGAVLGLEGSDVEVTAGSENLPMDCPPICEPGGDGGPGDGGPGDGGPGDGGGTPGGGTPDGGTPDGGAPDSGTPDAATPEPDASTPDAGAPDASVPDAATPDASAPDANPQNPEAGPEDAGTRDGGSSQTDAGPDKPDTGPKPHADSGPHTDTGRIDTGDDNGNGNGGCGCEISREISGKNQNSSPLNTAPLILAAAGLGMLSPRRRRKTTGVQ